MASTLPGFQSGGQPLFSGVIHSGAQFPLGSVNFKLSRVVSGLVFVGVALGNASGGITMNSGGAFSSGGAADAMELGPGDTYQIPRAYVSGNIDKVRILVPAAVSGTMRVYWDII